MARIYTIGHSNHESGVFLALLERHRIELLIDVRAQPYSAYATWFNREALESLLQRRGIAYQFEGATLGARPADPACYSDGRVVYERVAAQPMFATALQRAASEAERTPTALICAEGDPMVCHRSILLARLLTDGGIDVAHILADGALETQEQLTHRLMRMLELDQPDMFRTPEQQRQLAYDLQEERIAWRRDAVRGTS